MDSVNVVEETLKRLTSYPGVVGYIIINADCIPVKTTMDPNLSVQYAGLISQLVAKSRSVIKQLEPKLTPCDELLTLRLRTRKHELIICPSFEDGQEYTLAVVQNPFA